ncbi:tetraspanin-1-like isoform 1-T2 [Anomaloglossus baeobatrachus]|uniref:tetraspanin-1-like n=1 Tax=Anomaloglossus baeobatrachus TaxID=238106 RepID=UPI003F4F8701
MDDYPTGVRLSKIYAFMKYAMVFINAGIIICGSVLIGLGVWIKHGGNSFVTTLGSHSVYFLHVGLFCIAAGVIMIVLGFLGCCGAVKESRFLLLIFLLIMLGLFICEMAAAVLVLAFADVSDSIVKDKGLESIKEKYGSDSSGLMNESWDSIMKEFKCCGFFSYQDFINSTFSTKTGLNYPKTCCKDPALSECDGVTTSNQVIYTEGCSSAMIQAVRKHSTAIGIAAAVITGWELSSILVALMLFVRLG